MTPLRLRATRGGRREYNVLSIIGFVITLGMTGFDSVINRYASLLFGMATVPVTHMLHTIDAKNIFSALSETVENAFASLTPSYAMAA